MTRELTDQEWKAIDECLYAHQVFLALKMIRELVNCDLRHAIDINHERFKKLAAESPERFQCDLNTYWSGFYS